MFSLHDIADLVGLISGIVSLVPLALKGIMLPFRRDARAQVLPTDERQKTPPSLPAEPPSVFGPYPPASAVPSPATSSRPFIPYPWIFFTSLPIVIGESSVLIGGIIDATDFSKIPLVIQIIFGYALFAFLPTWIFVIVRAIQLKRWGWLVGFILAPAYSWLIFGIFGPSRTVNTIGASHKYTHMRTYR